MREIDARARVAASCVSHDVVQGDMVWAVHNNAKYRGRVESTDSESGVTVTLIDFDVQIEVPMSDLCDLPRSLGAVPPQGMTANLAFPWLVEDDPGDREWILGAVRDRALYARVAYFEETPHVVLCDDPKGTQGALNALVLSRAGVSVAHLDADVGAELSDLVESLREIDIERYDD